MRLQLCAAKRAAWEDMKIALPAFDAFENYVQQVHLSAEPELDEIENAWCEGGKAVVGRARAEGADLKPLKGDHFPPCKEAERYAIGGAYGMLVAERDVCGRPLRLAPWRT